MKLTLAKLRTIEAESRKVTKACREGKLSKERFSKKAKAVAIAIDGAGWCWRSEIRRVLEAVIGEKLPPKAGGSGERTGFFKKHAVIVCTKNPNSHDYGRKPVLLLRSGKRGNNLRTSGSRGNNLPHAPRTESPIRYATAAEVTTFFKAIRQLIKDKKSVAY